MDAAFSPIQFDTMRIAFLLLVLVHGALHTLGFIKAYKIREVKELAAPISKPMGLLWLLGTVLFLLYAFFKFTESKHAWLIGLLAVIVSQCLIVYFWKDAKFGTLPNVIILLAVLVSYGEHAFHQSNLRETANLLSQSGRSQTMLFTENEITNLPVPVQKWLLTSGVIGKEKIQMGRIEQKAYLKMKPEQANAYPATAVQYTTLDIPAFVWMVDVPMNSLMNFKGRDKFAEGRGEMLIKMNALIPVVNEHGEKLNEGSLQRYLGEMVWFPSLAASPYIQWESIDELTAKATMSYKGTSGSGTFYFNEAGDFTKFIALRYKDNTPEAKRYEWILTVDEYRVFQGIKVPSRMKATWKLETGDWTWLHLEITDIHYNENVR